MRTLRVLIPLIFLVMSWAVAQEDTNRILLPDTPIDGTLNADNAAQVFTFNANADDVISLTLTPQANLALTMVLTDADGTNLAQAVGDGTSPELLLEEFQIPAGGIYYVTIFASAGLDALAEGNFILTLSIPSEEVVETVEATAEPEIAVTPATPPDTFTEGQVILLNGLQVNLTWNTTDDLNLQIRDPAGGTLFWDSRTTNDGGSFGPDINGLCQVLTTPPAVETASWPGGPVATGSYEILVFYRQACEANSPVDFTVDVTVDGTALNSISGTLLPPANNTANVFLASFTVNQDGSAVVNASGPYDGPRALDVPVADLLNAEAAPILRDAPLQGLITNEQSYQTYTYAGLSGEIISIDMDATSGNLDTLLLVLDSSGNIIQDNDDRTAIVDTNSTINSLRLPTDGVYTIVATRYGKTIGGTQGEYQILVSGSDIPTELLNLELPNGDIEITLTWETNADLQLLVRDPSGNSVYDDTPTIPSGGRLTEQGNINCNISETSPVSYIYWPDGFLRIGSYEVEVWFQSECNDTTPVFFTIYVVVEEELIFTDNVSIQFNQKYLTSFSIDQSGIVSPSLGGIIGGSETLNYQSLLASAVNITSGQSVPGSITPTDKFDLYTFEGRAGDIVTISMTASSDTLDTLLFLIDPNGIEIFSNDDANETTNSLIPNVLLSQDGEYTVIATHYGAIYGGTTGGYNLSLRIDR